MQAGRQLAKGERLGHVVVGAGFQALDPVTDRIAGREHQDRGRDSPVPQEATEVHSAASRQHDVEDDDVVGNEQETFAAFGEVSRAVTLDLLFVQSAKNDAGELVIVFNNETLHVRPAARAVSAYGGI